MIRPNAAGKWMLFNLDEPSEVLAPTVVENIFAAEGMHRYHVLEGGSVILEGLPPKHDALQCATAI